MSAVETTEVTQAVELVRAGSSVSAAAKQKKVARSSVMRALRRAGVEPKAHPRGPGHHAWIDGRKAVKP